MVWARFDDDLPNRPEFLGLTGNAFRLYVEGVCYFSRYTTDGHIPPHALPHDDKRVTRELVDGRLWEINGSGIYVPQWAQHTPSRAELDKARAVTAQRVRRHRKGEP